MADVKPTRTMQPYRRGARNPGPALTAMLRGRSFSNTNPQDAIRNVQRLISAGKRKPQRGPRPARPARPAR